MNECSTKIKWTVNSMVFIRYKIEVTRKEALPSCHFANENKQTLLQGYCIFKDREVAGTG